MLRDSLNFLDERKLDFGVSVLGIPLDLGKDEDGAADAPNYLRNNGLLAALKTIGAEVSNLGDLHCASRRGAEMGDSKFKYLGEIKKVSEEAAGKVFEELKKGQKVIALGGDHTAALGTISGASAACNGDLGLIWVDAHGDVNIPETTPTGNIHGQVSAAMLGWGHPELVNLYQRGPKIKKENMLYLGLKDLDQTEVDILREEKLNTVTTFDILRNGFGTLEEKINELKKRVGNIWVSFDIDAVDKEYAPASLMPGHGRLNYREAIYLSQYIGKTCPVVGLDLVELAPKYDMGGRTASLAIEIIAGILGSEYNDYTRYIEKY